MKLSNLRMQLAALGVFALLSAAAFAQQKSPPLTVESNATNNTLEVAVQDPTPQRIQNLQVPAGFTITKFAEMYNPRMIEVAPNGTIYISARTRHDGDALATPTAMAAPMCKKSSRGASGCTAWRFAATPCSS